MRVALSVYWRINTEGKWDPNTKQRNKTGLKSTFGRIKYEWLLDSLKLKSAVLKSKIHNL